MANHGHPLDSVWAKIRRAEKHVEEFDQGRRDFLQSKPYSFTHHDDPETGRVIVSVKDIQPTPLELSLSIGDAIHNLRSALDLLICQLVRLKVSSHNCARLSFPISDNPQHFVKALAKEDMQLMGDSVLNELKGLQPYAGGKGSELWQLHCLDIRDKHRLLIIAPAALKKWLGRTLALSAAESPSDSLDFDVAASVPGTDLLIASKGSPILAVDPNELFIPSRGSQILRINADGLPVSTVGALKVNFKFIGDLAFNEPGIVQGKSVLDTLSTFVSIVKETVKKFQPFFAGSI